MYKLIIVDDEERILDGIANLFPWENIGFEVVGIFQGGRQALDYLSAHPVNVVMSDIKMTEIDGFTLIKEMEKYPKIKIVLFSSFQSYEYFRSAIKYQVADYLLKPIKYAELVNCFAEIKKSLDEEKSEEAPLETSRSYYDKVVITVKDYVDGHFKNASLEQAAMLVSLSSSYLSKIFKERAGIGFSEYLMKIRMERACEFLENIHYKSYEIADSVGYDNPKNFSRAFRAYYKMSPTEFRNKKIKEN
jgi:two-component system, response regulator YesN